jgi:hypothetical protein
MVNSCFAVIYPHVRFVCIKAHKRLFHAFLYQAFAGRLKIESVLRTLPYDITSPGYIHNHHDRLHDSDKATSQGTRRENNRYA